MKLLGFIAAFLISTQAFAYFATMDNGDILSEGKYRLMAGPQVVFNGENDGANFAARFDMGTTKSSNMRALVGAGATDFFGGLFYKWIPYPDTKNQPAIGLMGGFIFSREKYDDVKKDAISFRLHPIISKQFETDIGILTPYTSLPFGVTFVKGTTTYPIQLVGGTEFKPYTWQNISFFGEFGLDVSKAFSYIEVAIAFYFDETK